jgi:hypothetical protein
MPRCLTVHHRHRSVPVGASLVCHPGPTLGYRIEADGGSAVYLPDHEPALALPIREYPARRHSSRLLSNQDEDRWREPEWISGYDLAAGCDLLIHDAQYTDDEYERCIGWGHSTYRQAFKFAACVGARQLVPFHHDPTHDDATLDRLLRQAIEDLKPGFIVSAGREGTTFQVGG